MRVGFMSCFETEVHDEYTQFAFSSGETLLHYDLILWKPEFLHFGYGLRGSNHRREEARLRRDRERRLKEIELVLERGGNVVILCPKPGALHDWYQEGSSLDGRTQESLDVFAFLPSMVAESMRDNAVAAYGRKMDFRCDRSFLPAWDTLKGVAYYSVYFLASFGTPLLYVSDTDYMAATWFQAGNGNLFLVPSTQYDTDDDHPAFVKAGIQLADAVLRLSGETAHVAWEAEMRLGKHAVDSSPKSDYIHLERIAQLDAAQNDRFDSRKLVQLCKEVNECFRHGCYFATIFLIRTIIDHVPPILGCKTFSEVASNYSAGRSFREMMLRLDEVSRKIADLHLHRQIRPTEALPTETQINFSNELDILLAEIAAKLESAER